MTNREAHPDYASYPVGMRVFDGFPREKVADNKWACRCGCAGTVFLSDSSIFGEGKLTVITHDPRTTGKPFSFNPVGDGTTKSSQPSALLVALREAQAAIQRAIEQETANRPFAGLNRGE